MLCMLHSNQVQDLLDFKGVAWRFQEKTSRQCTWLTDPASTYALLHPRDGSAPEICKALTQGRRCGVHLAQQRPPLTRRKPGKAQPGPSAAKQSEPPWPGHSHEATHCSIQCSVHEIIAAGGAGDRKEKTTSTGNLLLTWAWIAQNPKPL